MNWHELKRRVFILKTLRYRKMKGYYFKIWTMGDYEYSKRIDNAEILRLDEKTFNRMIKRTEQDALNHLHVMIVTGGHGI